MRYDVWMRAPWDGAKGAAAPAAERGLKIVAIGERKTRLRQHAVADGTR